jgi:hypothetical protein
MYYSISLVMVGPSSDRIDAQPVAPESEKQFTFRSGIRIMTQAPFSCVHLGTINYRSFSYRPFGTREPRMPLRKDF